MRRLFICQLFIVFFSLAGHLSAQTAERYNALNTSVESLESKGNLEADARKIVKGIRKDLDFLSGKWLAAGQKELPNDYLATLKLNTEALSNADKAERSDEVRRLLDLVKADLDLKVSSARRGNNAAEDQGASITLVVMTRRDGKEVGGYDVICNSQFSRNSPISEFPFNNTTTAIRTLAPGRYHLKVRKDGFEMTRDIELGSKDREEVVFDIP